MVQTDFRWWWITTIIQHEDSPDGSGRGRVEVKAVEPLVHTVPQPRGALHTDTSARDWTKRMIRLLAVSISGILFVPTKSMSYNGASGL
jgi:hypothetical protein